MAIAERLGSMNHEAQAALEKLRAAVNGLEAQRALLGEAIVEPALESLREKIALLEGQIAAAVPTVGEERRIITVLFADIVGSTSRAEKMDPEEYREIVRAVHKRASQAIGQYHGRVLQLLGDGLLAVFGAGETTEKDPQNGVLASLAIHQSIGELQFQPPVQLRIGVHTGLALVGDLELDERREYTATGDVMNTAARLQNLAPPGGVLISQDTHKYVRGLFNVAPQPLAQLKGKQELLQTYLVHGVLPPRFRTVSRGVSGLDTPTIGRQAELAQIRSEMYAAHSGRTMRWVQLIGQPGIGKSRLVAEIRAGLEDGEAHLLKARAFQGDDKQAYALARRMWFDRFQISEDAALDEARERWLNGVRGILLTGAQHGARFEGNAEDAAHALGALVGLHFPAYPMPEPRELRGRAYVAARVLFEALRAEKPLALLLEDMHWADAASWDYLNQALLEGEALRPAQGSGLFILAAARPEWPPLETLPQRGEYRPIELGALSPPACQSLVVELLGGVSDLPASALQMVADRSEGVPYFAEELVNWLLDRGVIDRRAQPWRFVAERWQASPLPDTLQHLLLTRLEAAPLAEQAAIKCGAVFGRNFWEGGVEALGGKGSHALLEQAQQRGFVIPQADSTFQGEVEWSFYHALLRETAYESLLKRERRELHKAAAAWLEAQAERGGRLDEFAGLLAEHRDRGGQSDAAAGWYLIAGERAMNRGAPQEALRLAQRALELLPQEQFDSRWRVLLVHDECLGVLGQWEQRLEDDAALLALAEAHQNDLRLAEACRRQAYSLSNMGEIRRSLEAFERALAAARRAGSLESEAQTLGLMTPSLARLGEMRRAAQVVERAEILLPECTNVIIRSMILTNVSVYYGAAGDFVHAIRALEQQIEILRASSMAATGAVGMLNLGYYYTLLGMYDAGAALLEEALQHTEATGARARAAFARLNLGMAYWRQGRLPAARQTLEANLTEMNALGDPFGAAVTPIYLGLTLEEEQNYVQASQLYDQAATALRQLSIPGTLNDALAGLARCTLALGKAEQAGQHCGELWEYLQQEKGQGMEFPQMAYLTCVEVFTRLGEAERARLAMEQGCAELRQRAESISDPLWRRSFLENVPENVRLRAIRMEN
jgi:class 3 adenylate cyclase/tetratricopeptide (TPR) repeat protein